MVLTFRLDQPWTLPVCPISFRASYHTCSDPRGRDCASSRCKTSAPEVPALLVFCDYHRVIGVRVTPDTANKRPPGPAVSDNQAIVLQRPGHTHTHTQMMVYAQTHKKAYTNTHSDKAFLPESCGVSQITNEIVFRVW